MVGITCALTYQQFIQLVPGRYYTYFFGTWRRSTSPTGPSAKLDKPSFLDTHGVESSERHAGSVQDHQSFWLYGILWSIMVSSCQFFYCSAGGFRMSPWAPALRIQFTHCSLWHKGSNTHLSKLSIAIQDQDTGSEKNMKPAIPWLKQLGRPRLWKVPFASKIFQAFGVHKIHPECCYGLRQ